MHWFWWAPLLIGVTFLPVLLWSHIIAFMHGSPWNRKRFFLGIAVGLLSVASIYSAQYITGKEGLLVTRAAIFAIVHTILLMVVIILSRIRSQPTKKRHIIGFALLHTFILMILYIFSEITSLSFGYVVVTSSIFGFIFSALLEEGVKHLSTLSLSRDDLQFSLQELSLFTSFVALGFVFSENILYFILFMDGHTGFDNILSVYVMRSLFSLFAHVFSATLLTYIWWRALEHKFLSLQYISIFTIGTLSAVAFHVAFNMLVTHGYIFGLIAYAGIGYFFFTYVLYGAESEKSLS